MSRVPNIGSRVRGKVGVFYVDRPAEGEVMATKYAPEPGEIVIRVRLDDGTIVWVAATDVEVTQ